MLLSRMEEVPECRQWEQDGGEGRVFESGSRFCLLVPQITSIMILNILHVGHRFPETVSLVTPTDD